MEGAFGFLLGLTFLCFLFFGLALLYKNRAEVSKWLNTPYYAEEDRKLRLQRKIENAQKELEAIEKAEA